MTQRERALKIVRAQIDLHTPSLSLAKHRLGLVLAEAQNSLPDGGSDGSLDAEKWTQLSRVEIALDELLLSLRTLNSEVRNG